MLSSKILKLLISKYVFVDLVNFQRTSSLTQGDLFVCISITTKKGTRAFLRETVLDYVDKENMQPNESGYQQKTLMTMNK